MGVVDYVCLMLFLTRTFPLCRHGVSVAVLFFAWGFKKTLPLGRGFGNIKAGGAHGKPFSPMGRRG